MEYKNLNSVTPGWDGGTCGYSHPIPMPNVSQRLQYESEEVTVFFEKLEENMIAYIRTSIENYGENALFVGSIAWLTSVNILNELPKGRTQILIQKEDFLRPDIGVNKEILIDNYKNLGSFNHVRYSKAFCPCINMLSTGGDIEIEGIRTIGYGNDDINKPKMHNKYLILLHNVEHVEYFNGVADFGEGVMPISVWTGSYNPTNNSKNNLENAVIIRNRSIALQYFLDYQRCLSISESLDWECEWVNPGYRFGT